MSANNVSVDEESLRNDIETLAGKTVEETLSALLDEGASELVGAERSERTAGRESYRIGHYARKLVTGAGEVGLSVPNLRGATFQTSVTGTRSLCQRTCSRCCGWRGAFGRSRGSRRRRRPLTTRRVCVQGHGHHLHSNRAVSPRYPPEKR